MLIQKKTGNVSSVAIDNRMVDPVKLEWYETNKRILHKHSASGKEIRLKFLEENPDFSEGDVLYQDNETIIIIEIIPCESIVITAETLYETASICYEVGNRHLPLFYDNDELLVPYESPLFKLLQAGGYKIRKEKRKLLNPLRSTVSPHGHSSGETLFSKIMKLTTNE